MTVYELIELKILSLKQEGEGVASGAIALATRLQEKKNAGQVTPKQEEEWLTAILANVKKAHELRDEVAALNELLK